MAKRSVTHTITNPVTGEPYSFNTASPYTHVRFLHVGADGWIVSHHRTAQAALTGPNQTTAWNRYRRTVVEIATDSIVGPTARTTGTPAPGASQPERKVGPCPTCSIQINLAKPCPLCDWDR